MTAQVHLQHTRTHTHTHTHTHAHTHTYLQVTSPFVTFWFVQLLQHTDAVVGHCRAVLAKVKDKDANAPAVAFDLGTLPAACRFQAAEARGSFVSAAAAAAAAAGDGRQRPREDKSVRPSVKRGSRASRRASARPQDCEHEHQKGLKSIKKSKRPTSRL